MGLDGPRYGNCLRALFKTCALIAMLKMRHNNTVHFLNYIFFIICAYSSWFSGRGRFDLSRFNDLEMPLCGL